MKNIILLLLLTILSTTLFSKDVATITASKGDATLLRDALTLPTSVGLKLREKDSILTKANAKVQIIFNDETIITIGKNSNFSIEEYLYHDNEPVARFGMLGGAMRTITGKIGKIAPQKFSVTTKTATIGIRGTNFTVVDKDDGNFEAYCTYGEISVSINGIEYRVKQGYFISIKADNSFEIKPFNAATLREMRKKNFDVKVDKKSKKSKMDKNTDSESENNYHLNVTINDDTTVLIQDITQESKETIVKTLTLDSTIADYSMKDAIYFGNYVTQQNSSSLNDTGDVKLSIDFSNDTARLELGDFENTVPTTSYNFDNVNSNSLEGIQEQGEGSASLLFYGPTGNIVEGSFEYIEQQDLKAQGTYSAQTFESLH